MCLTFEETATLFPDTAAPFSISTANIGEVHSLVDFLRGLSFRFKLVSHGTSSLRFSSRVQMTHDGRHLSHAYQSSVSSSLKYLLKSFVHFKN